MKDGLTALIQEGGLELKENLIALRLVFFIFHLRLASKLAAWCKIKNPSALLKGFLW
jgi:hypothetical protein